jgi:hypothetical protein
MSVLSAFASATNRLRVLLLNSRHHSGSMEGTGTGDLAVKVGGIGTVGLK